MEFIKRNKSIFIFGLVLGAAFLAIIVIGWREAGNGNIILTPFTSNTANEEKRDEFYIAPQVENTNQPNGLLEGNNVETTTNDLIKTPEDDPVPLKQRPMKEILFTNDGFKPSVDSAHIAQMIRWTNTTDSQITIKELANKQSDKTPIILNPGEQLEIEITNTGFWTFKELNSGKTARFYIGEN